MLPGKIASVRKPPWTPSSANPTIKCLPSAWPPKPREALSFASVPASPPGRMDPVVADAREGDSDESTHSDEIARRRARAVLAPGFVCVCRRCTQQAY